MNQPEETFSDKSLTTPKWLKRIQENSWEAEILISGGAVFSLFQLADLLVQEAEYFKEVTPFRGLDETLIILMLILRGVTIGFMIHLLLRGFWISLVCLNSAYPYGINYQKLKIRGRYLEQSKKTNLNDKIVRLDQLSGLVFFGTFLFVVIIIGLSIWVMILIFLMKASVAYLWAFLLTWVVMLLALVYWVDILSSGLLRKNKVVSTLYYPVYLFFDTISLGFLYRHFLQIISTNINKWKAAVFIIFLYASSLLFTYLSLLGVLHLPNVFDGRTNPPTPSADYISDGLYLSRMPDEARVNWACIQSDIITDDFIRVFITYKSNYARSVEATQKKGFSEIVTVAINDSVYSQVEWHGYIRKVTGQTGIVAYLSISDLKKGKGELIIEINDEHFKRKKPGMRDGKLVIPFWKQ
jgi:hypothetical protein